MTKYSITKIIQKHVANGFEAVLQPGKRIVMIFTHIGHGGIKGCGGKMLKFTHPTQHPRAKKWVCADCGEILYTAYWKF